jgi:DNA-binding PadR family transcriptional regulator
MSVNGLQELEEMAEKLEATVRKLPQRPSRDELLRDIARFRVKLAALRARSFNGNQGEWLKAKGQGLK